MQRVPDIRPDLPGRRFLRGTRMIDRKLVSIDECARSGETGDRGVSHLLLGLGEGCGRNGDLLGHGDRNVLQLELTATTGRSTRTIDAPISVIRRPRITGRANAEPTRGAGGVSRCILPRPGLGGRCPW